ncbi:DUF2778 domain-containing protein [Mycetohabitans sp. B5]|uniref:Uncharacterized protein DUF2778 n=2 Tax=Burkholderiaceae TaxID=119060 RepID=A0A2P5K760_9BURK|nr:MULTISPECIES: DUF2778 domain-containing protein [Mycetohabitans]MCG1055046.1 DUF2778 domain-containing protein [Mycetohabitans sp. B5]PPB81898.1 uncharacterized protein DUF2778 [Mycetohabitans endofungorum]
MSISCRFTLNNRHFSELSCNGVGSFKAFSGKDSGRNNRAAVTQPNIGPLPPNRYYIVDRESGGLRSQIRDFFLKYGYGTDRSTWFALYRDDGVTDDWTIIQGVRRGNFRLHPIGPRRTSNGCITLANPDDFKNLYDHLKASPTIPVPGRSIRAYGTVDVR